MDDAFIGYSSHDFEDPGFPCEEVEAIVDVVTEPEADRKHPLGVELKSATCFKTISGIQAMTTITREDLLDMDTTDETPPVGREEQVVGKELDGVEPTAGGSGEQPTSTEARGADGDDEPEHVPRPLNRLSLMIGKKVLRFKVINASEAPQQPDPPKAELDSESTWLKDALPVTKPKSLAGLFRCAQCKTYFGTKTIWQKHMTTFHADPRPFRCIHCGMKFANKAHLSVHLRQHVGTKQFACSKCPKKFGREEARDLHEKIHEARSACDNCGRFFVQPADLERHKAACFDADATLDSANKQMRHKCSFCDKCFFLRRDKVSHERVHTGERPYSCGFCGRRFAQSQSLTIHIRSHTGERPYACSTCGKPFRDNSSLRKHELLAHAPPLSQQQHRQQDVQMFSTENPPRLQEQHPIGIPIPPVLCVQQPRHVAVDVVDGGEAYIEDVSSHR